ncbi:MAG: hypothetical protein U9M90_01210 [Patescibacteria group bacterium]|nr:hypothetical protein [Patescibacteria group bacterium]
MDIRRAYIQDVVKKYKRSHPEEYEMFVEQVKKRRAKLADPKYASIDKEKDIRLAVSLPQKVSKMFDYAMNGVDEKRFGEVKGEMEWFVKKYPEFLIPNKL